MITKACQTRDEVRELMSETCAAGGAYTTSTDAVVEVCVRKAAPDDRFEYARAGTSPSRARGSVASTRFSPAVRTRRLMKANVERPRHVVDIGRLPLARIEGSRAGTALGALVPNNQTPTTPASSPLSAARLGDPPGASPPLRNAATNGGNLTAHALLTLLRHRHRLQQARAGSGCAPSAA